MGRYKNHSPSRRAHQIPLTSSYFNNISIVITHPNQSIHQSINQSIYQSINQSLNESINPPSKINHMPSIHTVSSKAKPTLIKSKATSILPHSTHYTYTHKTFRFKGLNKNNCKQCHSTLFSIPHLVK